MKKIIALLLSLVMVFALCACGQAAAPAASEAPASEAPAVDSDRAYVQDKGKLVVGITDFAPHGLQGRHWCVDRL